MKRMLIAPVVCCAVLSMSSQATTLTEVVTKVLDTNPIIQERLHNYRATKAELRGSEAGIGKDYKGRFTAEKDEDYDVFHNALIIRQNIFNGFSTSEQVNYNTQRTLAAAYSFLEKANDVTLRTIKAYVDVLRYKELYNNAKTHVRHIEKLHKKVIKSYKAGLTKMSEVSKVRSSLYSAKSNLLVARNRLANSVYNFRRVTGTVITPRNMKKVKFNLPLPKDHEKAAMYALEYNPSLRVT